MPLTAQVHYSPEGDLLLSFGPLTGAPMLTLGPFRTVCRLEEAAGRLLSCARSGAAFELVQTEGKRHLSASGQRWRLPVQHAEDALSLAQWAAQLPTLRLDDQRPPERRRFDLTGPLARLMP